MELSEFVKTHKTNSNVKDSDATKSNESNKPSVIVEKKKTSSVKNSGAPSNYGTGRRKNAAARVWVKPGKGVIMVNKKPISTYFPTETHQHLINKPFEVTNSLGNYDVVCTVKGGGTSGQVGAIQHGISRALDKLVPEFHVILRSNGLLTRDSRMVERKKYGKSGARKSYQFSKR